MKKEKIIDIIIAALQEKDVLFNYHKMQNGKALQIKLKDQTYFNIMIAELKSGRDNIVTKLKL